MCVINTFFWTKKTHFLVCQPSATGTFNRRPIHSAPRYLPFEINLPKFVFSNLAGTFEYGSGTGSFLPAKRHQSSSVTVFHLFPSPPFRRRLRLLLRRLFPQPALSTTPKNKDGVNAPIVFLVRFYPFRGRRRQF
jgi:hypothetical protein